MLCCNCRYSRSSPHVVSSPSNSRANSPAAAAAAAAAAATVVTDVGLHAFADLVRNNSSLQQLRLQGVRLSKAGSWDLLAAMDERRICVVSADFGALMWRCNEVIECIRREQVQSLETHTPRTLRVNVCGQPGSGASALVRGWWRAAQSSSFPLDPLTGFWSEWTGAAAAAAVETEDNSTSTCSQSGSGRLMSRHAQQEAAKSLVVLTIKEGDNNSSSSSSSCSNPPLTLSLWNFARHKQLHPVHRLYLVCHTRTV